DKNSDDLIAFCQSQICAQTKKVVLPGDFESYCEAIGRGPLNIDPDIDDLLDTTPEDVFNSISGYGMFRGGKIQHSFQKLCNYKKENTGELSELANIACTGSSKDDARCNDTYFKVLKLIGRHQQTSSEKSARSGDTNERISEKTEIADNPEGDSGAGKYVLERDSDNSESYDLISHLFDLPLPEPVEPVNIPERKVVAQNQIKDGNVKEQVIHTTTSKKGMDTGRTQTSLTQTVMPKGSRRIVDTGQKFQRLPTRKTGNEIIQPPVASSSANKFVRSPGTETTHFSPVRESLAFGSGTSNKSFEKNSKYSDLNNAIDKTFAKYQKRRIPTNEIREIYTPDTSNRAFFGSNTGIANVPSISSQQMRNALRNTNISQGDLVQNGIPNTSAIISSLANKKNIATAKVYRNLIQNKLDKNGKIEKSDFSNISKKLGVDISKPFLTFNNGLPVLIKPVFDKDGNITGHQPIAKISQKMLTMLTKEQEELIKNYKQGRASHKQLEKILDQMSPWKKTNQYEIWLIRDSSGRPCALAKTPTDGVCRFYLSPAVELDQNKFISIKTLNSIGIMLRHSDSQQEIGKFFETLN
ncbi:MAG: hypothetical protein KAQ98_13740, partial [Bacteriovoracaceae bacterium]|nr:hypothetical protein [Bacteriovoracaceae bacterium]